MKPHETMNTNTHFHIIATRSLQQPPHHHQPTSAPALPPLQPINQPFAKTQHFIAPPRLLLLLLVASTLREPRKSSFCDGTGIFFPNINKADRVKQSHCLDWVVGWRIIIIFAKRNEPRLTSLWQDIVRKTIDTCLHFDKAYNHCYVCKCRSDSQRH